jgi:hypothetical protein
VRVDSGGLATDGGGADELGFGDGAKPRGVAAAVMGGELGERARGPRTGRRGRRVGVYPELDPGSVASWCGGARLQLTRGPRVSVARSGVGERAALGRENLAGTWAASSCWAATQRLS